MEKMADFFTARVDGYDEHMINTVEGCKEAYVEMAKHVPLYSETLLDLGCGTGLELQEIFKVLPNISVTGVDLTQAMLDKLQEKYSDKSINLICASYFDVPFGKNKFNCAVSFETMHHFSHEAKIGLYNRILHSLKENGVYIECDYMVETQKEEDFFYSENTRIRKELNISESEFYHYDTPCTIDNQISLLKTAGFSKVDKVFRMNNTTILVAYK